MSNFKTLFTSTRGELLNAEESAMLTLLKDAMNLAPGDFLEVQEEDSPEWRPCRIEGVETCFINRGGGYTARLKVMRLKRDGRIGVGRTLTLSCAAGRHGTFKVLGYKKAQARRRAG